MKYKDKMEFEVDDLDIKTHLNEALECEGILVSEDLISRTLNRIHSQSEDVLGEHPNDIHLEQKQSEVKNRNISINMTSIFKYGGIVAASLLLFAGIYAGLGTKNKSSDSLLFDTEMSTTQEESTEIGSSSVENSADRVAGSDAGADISHGIASTELADQEVVKENEASLKEDDTDDLKPGAEITENGTVGTENIETQFTVTPVDVLDKSDLLVTGAKNELEDGYITSMSAEETFDEISDISFEEVKLITIIEESSQEEIILVEETEMDKLYHMMKENGFKLDNNIDENILDETMTYRILLTLDLSIGVSKELLIGDVIVLKDILVEGTDEIYIIKDKETLINGLEGLFDTQGQ